MRFLSKKVRVTTRLGLPHHFFVEAGRNPKQSPQYLGGQKEETLLRAMAMKILNPKLKLIVVICDPIKQQYSQLRPVLKSLTAV